VRSVPTTGPLFYVLGQGAQLNGSALAVEAGEFSGSSTSGYAIFNGYLTSPTGSQDQFLSSLALDAAGNVYMGDSPQNGVGQVAVFPANLGCSGPARTLQGSNTTLQSAQSVAVDQAGYVYVSNAEYVGYYSQQYGELSCALNQIALFAPLKAGTQNVGPLATITDPVPQSVSSCEAANNTTQADHLAIALDAHGNIYAASYMGNEVFVYPARSGSTLSATPIATIQGGVGSTSGIIEPNGIAVDAGGRIYVTSHLYGQTPNQGGAPAIAVDPANPSGTNSESPVAVIAGSSTTLSSPNSVALDRNGVIYVVDDSTQNRVLEFPANPNGAVNEAPRGILHPSALFGSGTTIAPQAITAH
jgi:sugar lactone lactonase YvrE